MARTSAWRSVAAALAAAALFGCKEEISAPGRCPQLCPDDNLQVADTILTGVVVSDTSIRGYTTVWHTPTLITSSQPGFSAFAVIRMSPLPQFWVLGTGDTVFLGPIDSVTFQLQLDVRDTAVNGTVLRMHHLPAFVDSTTPYDSLLPYFNTLFDTIQVSDTVRTAILNHWMPVAEVNPPAADSNVQAIGISVQAAGGPTVAILASSEFGTAPPRLKYYVRGHRSAAATVDTFKTTFDLVPTFDSYVQKPDPVPPPAGRIVVGNQPSSRSFVQFDIPSYLVDSVTVVRATLLLEPVQPATGFPGEVFTVEAMPLLRFYGGKSLVFADTTGLVGTGRVAVGGDTTVAMEVGRIVRLWRGVNPDSLPRAVVLRTRSELFTYGQLDAAGSTAGALAPRLRIAYLKPFHFGVP